MQKPASGAGSGVVELFLTMLVKPFVAFVMLCLVFVIAALLHKVIPEGKIKRILYSPLPGHRKKPRRY